MFKLTSPHPKMPDKLLKGLNSHKAAGPDKLKPIVLHILLKELAPILKPQNPLDTGKLPSIWKQANVSHIFKKEDKTEPANYQPIFFTCVLCKVLEHVVASGISKHFTDQTILLELQHVVRQKLGKFLEDMELDFKLFSLLILVFHALSLKNPSDTTLASLSIAIYPKWRPRWRPIISENIV